MRLALAIVSLAFVLVTLAAANFETAARSSSEPLKERVWVAGQVGRDGTEWGVGAEEQARIAFRNLETELEAAGGSLDDVVELTFYQREPGALGSFRAVVTEVFGAQPPLWTAVEVADLADPASLVEIKATAILGGR